MTKQGDDSNTGNDAIGDKSEAFEISKKDDTDEAKPEISLAKLHTMTVCMVPPPHNKSVWEAVTKARTELKDPGLFRWPPHANLLYPFLNIDPSNSDETIHEEKFKLLGQAVSECEPFRVALDTFGTFGGTSRGVLFLHPRSFEIGAGNSDSDNDSNKPELGVNESTSAPYQEPLIALQSTLFRYFPECPDQHKQGKFTPHMTISHFTSLEGALEGKAKVESWWSPHVEFDVTEIYLLKRVGDDGAFKIVATLPLGSAGKSLQVHTPPVAFPEMPLEEEDWVREERMKMKARRNGNSNGRRGRKRSGKKKKERVDRGPSRSVDTPEVIAQKRAERAAKREVLAQQAAGKNTGD